MAIKTPTVFATMPLSGEALTVELDTFGVFEITAFFF